MSIRILTDSAADFSTEELRQHGIVRVPLQVIFGEDAYEDGETLSSETFWQKLIAGENPKTSQASPERFLAAFKDAQAAGDDVVLITISSALSGTMQSAMIASSMIDYDRIHIVDSEKVATAQKLLVLYACRLRDEGEMSAAQIAQKLSDIAPRIRLYACLDTLTYLARGGRIPKAVASVGAAVRFKPLITLSSEGAVEMAGKGIGLHRATEALNRFLIEAKRDPDFPILPLYTYNPDNALSMIKKLSAAGIPVSQDDLCAVGSTIGTHVGPNAFGFVFVEAE